MRAVPASLLALAMLTSAACAACDVKQAKIEEAIAAKKELQEPANKQMVRDLRTLRDAAIVLDTYGFRPECAQLLEIVKSLLANPEKTIEQSGDTDEEKAEAIEEAREPKGSARPE